MVSIDIAPDDLELLSKFVNRLGGYAEGLFDYHDFGFPKSALKNQITRVTDELRRMQQSIRGSPLSLRPPGLPEDAMWEEADELWNYGQTLRFAAGATMITQRYESRMTSENLRRSMIAKVLHHCQAGLLDDLIDMGRYTFIEAKDLYHHCLASMIDPGFEINTFRKELALSLNQEQLGMFDLMTNITAAFNRLFLESPNGQDLFYELQRVDDRLILGQALTMFQKHPTMDLPKLKRIAAGLSAPDPDLKWHERISQALSGATYYNLIDMCFLSEPVTPHELQGTVNSWYYYDLVITRLNHFVGVHKDLRSGIANLALIAMRENELVTMPNLQGYNPNLTMRDYEEHSERTAEFSRRALTHATKELGDGSLFYPFITIMVPVVMMAEWIGNRDNMIHSYLRAISPSIRDSVRDRGIDVATVAARVAARTA
jgi:hypothetical protein